MCNNALPRRACGKQSTPAAPTSSETADAAAVHQIHKQPTLSAQPTGHTTAPAPAECDNIHPARACGEQPTEAATLSSPAPAAAAAADAAANAAVLLDAEFSRRLADRQTLEAMAAREHDALASQTQSSLCPEVRRDLLRLTMVLTNGSPRCCFDVALMLDREEPGLDPAAQKARLGSMIFSSQAFESQAARCCRAAGASALASACGTTLAGLKAGVRQLLCDFNTTPSTAEWLHVFFERLFIVAEVCRNDRLKADLSCLYHYATQYAISVVMSRRQPPSKVAVVAVCAAFVARGLLSQQDLGAEAPCAARSTPSPAGPPRGDGPVPVSPVEALSLISMATLCGVGEIRACISSFSRAVGDA